MIYDVTNILEVYDDCDACNKVCYKITECLDADAGYAPLVWATDDPDFAVYVGTVVKFTSPYVYLLSDGLYYEFKPGTEAAFLNCVDESVCCNPLTNLAAFEAWVIAPSNLAAIQAATACFVVVSGADHCGLVETYVCRREDYWLQSINVLDCVATCEDCLPVLTTEPEMEFKQRNVKPGYDITCDDTDTTC